MRVSVVLTTDATPSPACLQALVRQSHPASQVLGLPATPGTLGQRWNSVLQQADADLFVLLPDGYLPVRHWLKSIVRMFESRVVAAVSSRSLDGVSGEALPHQWICDRLGRIREEPGPLWAYQHPFHQAHQTLNAAGVAFRVAELVRIHGFDGSLEHPDTLVAEACRQLIAGQRTLVHNPHIGLIRQHSSAAPPSLRDRLILALRHALNDAETAEILQSALADVSVSEPFALRDTLALGLPLPRQSMTSVAHAPVQAVNLPPQAMTGRCDTIAFVAPSDDTPLSLAAQGHDIHIFTDAVTTPCHQWERGIWHHRPKSGQTLDDCLLQWWSEQSVDAIVLPASGAGEMLRRHPGLPTLTPTGPCSPMGVAADTLRLLGIEPASMIVPAVRQRLPQRLVVSVITNCLMANDAMSNISRQQADAISLMAPQWGMQASVKLFAMGVQIDDPRGVVVPDAQALATDPHYAGSDLIVFNFGFLNPLMDAIHLAPRWAKIAVWYHGITPPGLMPPAQHPLIIDGFRQTALLQLADQVFVASSFLIDDLQRIGLPESRIERLPLANAKGPLPTTPRPPVDLSQLRLMYLGRIQPSKGIRELLDAFLALRQQLSLPVRLDMFANVAVSDPALIAEIETRIEREQLGEVIRFHFGSDNATVREHLRTRDVLLIPSHHEGFCVPVIEALSLGCRVITSNAGALPETSGGWGRMHPVQDVAGLLERLLEFVDARARGGVMTDHGFVAEADWLAGTRAYVESLQPERFAAALCRGLFSDLQLPSPNLTPYLRERHQRCLTESGITQKLPSPPAPEPCTEMTTRCHVQRLRALVRRVPMVGAGLRYLKRLIYLPWNFHILFQQFQETMQRERESRR